MTQVREPVALAGCGMVTSVGLSAPASAAAIRAGVAGASETPFIDWGGERIVAHSVPLALPAGRAKLVRMLAMAVDECMAAMAPGATVGAPLVLCVAEAERPGRPDAFDGALVEEIEAELGVRFASGSRVIAQGRVGGLAGLHYARSLIHGAQADAVIVAGVDGYINWPTMSSFETRYRLLTSKNSNGFMPGEAAGAVLVTAPRVGTSALCAGVGFAREPATLESGEPLRGVGLAQAIRGAADEAGCSADRFAVRVCDVSGEQYYFKEAALVLARLVRESKEEAELWHPAECIGEVGAAVGPIVLALAAIAYGKGYAPGSPLLCHFSNDDGQRAAALLTGGVAS